MIFSQSTPNYYETDYFFYLSRHHTHTASDTHAKTSFSACFFYAILALAPLAYLQHLFIYALLFSV